MATIVTLTCSEGHQMGVGSMLGSVIVRGTCNGGHSEDCLKCPLIRYGTREVE